MEHSVKTGKLVVCNRQRMRKRECLLNLCDVVAQLVTSQPVTVDTTVTFFSNSDVGSRENSSHHPLCTAHLNTFCVVSHSRMAAEPVIGLEPRS